MGELVAGAVLGGFFQLIFSQANIPAAARKLFSFYGVEQDLEKIERRLRYIKTVIGDAEAKLYSNNQVVRVWMEDLKDVAYDMDDILDEMRCRRLHLHVQSNFRKSGKKYGGHFFLILKSKVEIKFFHKIVGRKLKKKIVKVLEKLEGISDTANLIGLKNIVETQSVEPRQFGNKERQTTQTMDKSRMVGRECDRNRIIELLRAPDGGASKNYTVISIVGMGGVGKTSLAQLVFNDDVVKSMFNITFWACVSDIFNPDEVWKQLVECVEPGNSHGAIEGRLKNLIQNKHFLLVLDDMWTEDVLDWHKLSASFNHGSRGSKIIVTTRSEAVARTVESNTIYGLDVMGNEECWDLFHEMVFGDAGMHSDEKRKLEAIAKEIVAKCGGLPLAVKVIAGILRVNRSEEKWRSILKNTHRIVEQNENEKEDKIMHTLRISYYYLPSYLKRCFEYFSIFPKDYKFNKNWLAQLWIAEGFVLEERERKVEDIAREYYEELQQRSLIQSNGMVHDIIHDLACHVSGKFYRNNVNNDKSSRTDCKSIRHARFSEAMVLDSLIQAKSLRTFIFKEILTSLDTEIKLSNWKYLRVLELENLLLNSLAFQNNIRFLKHLRYLRLANCEIESLAKSIGLYALQVLEIEDCHPLDSLPEDMGDLVSLKHINVSFCDIDKLPNDMGNLTLLKSLHLCNLPLSRLPDSIFKLDKLELISLEGCKISNLPDSIGELGGLKELHIRMTGISSIPPSFCNLTGLRELDFSPAQLKKVPRGIGNLVHLRQIECFPVGAEEGSAGIEELHGLNSLEGYLVIDHLENVGNVQDAEKAELHKKLYLTHLTYKWHPPSGGDDGAKLEAEVLEALQPYPANLEHLKFTNFRGEMLPTWLGKLPFPRLRVLTIHGAPGLLSLNHLHLLKAPQLESLDILDCTSLAFEQATSLRELTSLKYLTISRCPNLVVLPRDWLPMSLIGLRFYDCRCFTSIQDWDRPTSLTRFTTYNCHRSEFSYLISQ